MGGEVQEIYENNSILRSSSILYNLINLISSYVKRLVPVCLTPRQCENSFNKSITRDLYSLLHNSFFEYSSYLGIKESRCHTGQPVWHKAEANSIIRKSSSSNNSILLISSYKRGVFPQLI